MTKVMTKELIAQWVIDNRYGNSENNKISDHEMYHNIVDEIESLIKNHGDIGDVSTMLIAFEQWKIDGDVKNLLPKQIVEWYIEESNL